MCGGGGDDSAAQMRADEAAREKRMAAAVARINTMFGVRPAAPSASAAVPDGNVLARALADATARLALPQQQQTYVNQVRKADSNARVRDRMYDTTRGDILDYFTDQLGEQRDQAASTIGIDMARRGLTYGSAATDADRRLQDVNNQRLMELTTRADSATTEMRTSDEQARLDLIARIRAGMDTQSAIAGANSSLQNNINRSRESAMSGSLEGLFSEVEDLYGQRRAVDAYNRGYQDTVGVTTPGSGTTANGRVYD